jgi:hypothetical protein
MRYQGYSKLGPGKCCQFSGYGPSNGYSETIFRTPSETVPIGKTVESILNGFNIEGAWYKRDFSAEN